MRALLMGATALVSTPLLAQAHAGHAQHAEHADHSAHSPQVEPEIDHCAMGHLPPEQCPDKHGEPDHAKTDPAMDHSAHAAKDHAPQPQTDHSAHGVRDQSAQGAMDHSSQPEMDHSAHGSADHSAHGAIDHSAHGSAQDKSAPGAAPEHALPPRALEGPRHAADLIWGETAMAPARAQMANEHGDFRTGLILIERLETRFASDGADTEYVWDAQAWYGGDLDRVVLKSEGEGAFGGEIEDAEIQALYSRAITPFFDLQAGVRYDPVPDDLTHLVIGMQGLAPYMLHVDGALFLSDRGDLTARIEAEYDQKITQRLILQPRIEIEASAQDIPDRETASGLTKVDTGLRLRYEIVRELAPYVGIEYESRLGGTAELARARGQDPDGFRVLAGIRAWF